MADGGHTRTRLAGRRTTGYTTAMVSAEDIDWLVAHLQAVVTGSTAAWAGKGMTLSQLTALHFISAQAPVPLIELAHALGTGSPTTRHRRTPADGAQRYEPAGPSAPYQRAKGHRRTIRRAAKGTPYSPVTSSLLAAFTERFTRNGQRGRHCSVRGDG